MSKRTTPTTRRQPDPREAGMAQHPAGSVDNPASGGVSMGLQTVPVKTATQVTVQTARVKERGDKECILLHFHMADKKDSILWVGDPLAFAAMVNDAAQSCAKSAAAAAGDVQDERAFCRRCDARIFGPRIEVGYCVPCEKIAELPTEPPKPWSDPMSRLAGDLLAMGEQFARPPLAPLAITEDRPKCQWVTDNDDSIGGEGEISCGGPMDVDGDTAVCTRGHQWERCDCGGSTCAGWRVTPRDRAREATSPFPDDRPPCRECRHPLEVLGDYAVCIGVVEHKFRRDAPDGEWRICPPGEWGPVE